MMTQDKPVNLLWTSGWDSTFRLLELIIMKKKVVQTYYLIDHNRQSLRQEIMAMKKIKEALFSKYPETRTLLLPTKFYAVIDLQPNIEISQTFKHLSSMARLGNQYEWIALFAQQHGFDNLEMSALANLKSKEGLSFFFMGNTEKVLIDGEYTYTIRKDTPPYPLFKYYRFPIIGLSKVEMGEIAKNNGFYDILLNSWFCLYPTKDGQPCGKCKPCEIAIKDKLSFRLPLRARLVNQYYDYKKKLKKLFRTK
jgi:hypothetical protein